MLLASSIAMNAFGQAANRHSVPSQALPADTSAMNFMFIDTTAGNMNRFWTARTSSLKISAHQLRMWWPDTMVTYTKKSLMLDSLSAIRFLLGTKLTSSDTTGKWKHSSYVPSWSSVTGKPSFSTVATSGSYNDLSNQPSIPSAQINSDWNSVSGLSQILNKPNLSNYYLASNPNGYISSVPAQSFSSLTGKPTTLSGYAISDAYPLSGNPSGFLTSVPAQSFSSLTGKPTTISGYGITDATSTARSAITLTTTGSGAASYNQSTGDLNIPTPVTAKRQITYSGTSDASGNYTVTFSTSFSVAPNIQANVIGSGTEVQSRVVSVSTTGFTVNVFQRVSVLSLALSTATTPVNGATVHALITEF